MSTVLTDTDKETLVAEVINGYFERSIDYAARIDPSYRYLWESLYALIRSGGKRLRPKMLLMAYEAFGGQEGDKLIPIAAAQELLHFCLLIHDDIIDRDYIRYGTENIAGRYKNTYAKYIDNSEELTHFAHSAAILGGDLMLSGAYRLIAESSLDEEQKLVAQSFLSTGVFEVAGGELLDTELSFTPNEAGDALKVARYKTASYTFITPILTGATLAGISDIQTKALNDYAQSIGIAYQLVDDLLGIFGSEDKTGKSTSSDIVEGKRTYMVEKALEVMEKHQQEEFFRAFGNQDATAEEIAAAKALLQTSGAKTATEELARSYATKAHDAITAMGLEERYAKEFENLVRLVTERSH